MKIAQIAPLYEAVPPKLYGGTERVVAHLTDALVDLGHEVTLFASADAETRAELVPVRDQAIRLDPAPLKSDLAAHMSHAGRGAPPRRRVRRDPLPRRHDPLPLLRGHRRAHADHPARPARHEGPGRSSTALEQPPLVSISDDQRRYLPDANWAGTVHHGMDSDLYRFSPRSEGYLAFLGRISPEKRPDRAIAIAKRLGRRLKIAAKVDAADANYFRNEIEPLLDHPLIEFIGEIGDPQKSAFLGGADALLFPIDWPEPFGLVMIEAMACGTPVIAWGCGSAPEVIDDGVTGFIVESEAEADQAVWRARASTAPPCAGRFSNSVSPPAVMASRYVRLSMTALAVSNRQVDSTVKRLDPELMRIA